MYQPVPIPVHGDVIGQYDARSHGNVFESCCGLSRVKSLLIFLKAVGTTIPKNGSLRTIDLNSRGVLHQTV
jgi:hypothetical protein